MEILASLELVDGPLPLFNATVVKAIPPTFPRVDSQIVFSPLPFTSQLLSCLECYQDYLARLVRFVMQWSILLLTRMPLFISLASFVA